MTETTAEQGMGRIGAAGASVAVAAMVTNGLAYLVPMLGARHLTVEELSILATVLALVAIVGVTGTGLQMAIAVHRARNPGAPTTRITVVTTVVTGLALGAAAPLLMLTLRLSATILALAVAMTVAVVLAGGRLGELQGDQRFHRLASGMAVLAVGRYAGMVMALGLGADVVGTLLAGVVTGYVALPVLAWIARPDRRRVSAGDSVAIADRLRIKQVLSAGTAALAMLVVSYADLIFARQLLPAAESGAYAVGTVLTKGALWAPQVVTVLALPRLAVGDGRARSVALGVVGACGAVLVGASTLAGGLAFRLAGGADYVRLGDQAPYFAATGALYALVFVLVNAKIAAGTRWPSAPLWAATVGLAVLAVLVAPRTFEGVMWSAVATAAFTFLVTLLSSPTARSAAGGGRSSRPGRADVRRLLARAARPG